MTEDTNTKLITAHIMLPKTLVLVLPGSMFGSAESQLGRKAREYRNAIAEEILSHDGHFAVIDGCLSDEIQRGFDDVIEKGLSNAILAAERMGCPNSISAVRMYGCDTGEVAYDGWQENRSYCLDKYFDGPDDAAEFLSEHLETSEITVTGAWATLDDSSGCVNGVVQTLRSLMPNIQVRISETAIFEEYEDGELDGLRSSIL
ncbi:hypothetical protein [Sulfitobacter pontiacus]|uniref:hypothetical protein n=1 Tax=Sulfitobacter pontiacus TaxID=60137 RepID=UPI0030EC6DAE